MELAETMPKQIVPNIETVPVLSAEQNLVQLVQQLIKEQQYEGVKLLFTSETDGERNRSYLYQVGADLMSSVCLEYLNRKVFEEQVELYSCAEELLKIIAAEGPAEEVLLELLELVEESDSEYVFTSSLRALQTVLLRLADRKPRALEWSLNSIYTNLCKLPLPDYLNTAYDEQQQQLLEQDEMIQSLLMHYVTVGLFNSKLLQNIYEQELIEYETRMNNTQKNGKSIFRDCGHKRINIMCCFLVKLLGKPLSLLDLSTKKNNSNKYTVQCAADLTQSVTQCIKNPFFFLQLVEDRVRWRPRRKDNDKVQCSNMFLDHEKCPLDALAIYFYLLFVEKMATVKLPNVYAPTFKFDTGMYLVMELLEQEEAVLHAYGMRLAKHFLEELKEINYVIPVEILDLPVIRDFCYVLCNIAVYSMSLYCRQFGVALLRQFILQFNDEAKYLILNNLLCKVTHSGISGFLCMLYKDLVASKLAKNEEISAYFCGNDFRTIFLKYICNLPNGAQTDLNTDMDKIVSSLNAIRYFAIQDLHNKTGFWDFYDLIESQFVEPLNKALDLSVAHYKAELKNTQDGKENTKQENEAIVDIQIKNAQPGDNSLMKMDREQKIQVLKQNMLNFDCIRSLLVRLVECVENSKRIRKENLQQLETNEAQSGKEC